MNLNISKDLTELSATQYASQGNAILGIRDSGKSYTAMKVAEELMSAGIPIIAFDPTGIWKNLKIGVDGNPGYQIVVAGGNEPDIKLTSDVESVTNIIRAAMIENISLVIDLYSLELANKSTWIKIVETAIRVLMYENHQYNLRHIFLEEAAEFIPQKLQPQHHKVYSEIERLARMGRNFHLGYTIINQRAEEVNKAILEIAEMTLLHKQVGKNSLLSLQTWFKVQQVDSSKIMMTLSQLAQGACWVVGKELKPICIKVSKKKTFHPDPKKKKEQTAKIKTSKANVSDFIAKMNNLITVENVVKPGKDQVNNDALRALREENAKLKTDNQRIRAELTRVRVSIKDAAGLIVQKITPVLRDHIEHILHALPTIGDETIQAIDFSKVKIGDFDMTSEPVKHMKGSVMPHDGNLGKCERAILSVLAQRAGVSTNKAQLSILSGYSISSSGFANALSSLRTKKYMTGSDTLSITNEGITAVGSFDFMPTGPALVAYWSSKIGKAEAAILKVLIDHFPQHLSKKEIADKSGYSITSSGFANALSTLRTLQLIEGYSSMVAAEIFWQ
jgi:hypothetical protein